MAIWEPVNEGSTLSQIGLAIRLGCDPSTIRRMGQKPSGYVQGRHATWREHWEEQRYATGALRGYRFVRREGDIERVTVMRIVQDKDPHMLKSILGNLQELKSMTSKRIKDGSISMLGVQALADNIEWLQDFIERADRPAD